MRSILQTSRTDDVIAEIGNRLRQLRLAQNLRIQDLAARSGVSARTISRLENGSSVSVEHLVKVLRGLGRLQALDNLVPPPLVSPLQVAKLRGRVRERASRPKDG